MWQRHYGTIDNSFCSIQWVAMCVLPLCPSIPSTVYSVCDSISGSAPRAVFFFDGVIYVISYYT